MYLKFVLIPPESKKVISENLSQLGQIVQKQEKGFAAVHNKLEPPNTGNILVSRQMKAEEWYNGVKLWYFVYQYCPAFSLVYHKSIRIYQVSELTFEMATLGLLHRTDPLAAVLIPHLLPLQFLRLWENLEVYPKQHWMLATHGY